MSDCIFCKIAAGQIGSFKVYEDDHVLAFLDIGPIRDGHTLLIPKHHCSRLEDCPPQALEPLMARLAQLAGAVQQAMDADGYNILCNSGRAAGQIVEHLHFHIIPRKTGDGVFKHWPSFQYPEGRALQVAEKIRQKLKK